MKVKELIEQLSKHDGELEAIGYDYYSEGHHGIETVIVADTNDPDALRYDKGDDPVSRGWIKRGEKFLYLIG